MKGRCGQCGQPLPEIRLGVRLTPLKARIFDIIKRAGDAGIDRHDLFNIVFGDDDAHQRRHSFATLKSHLWQINEQLEGTNFRIAGRAVRLVNHNARHT